jgi:hypothetical protein
MSKRLFVSVLIAGLLIVVAQIALHSASADGPQPGVAFQATETPAGEEPTVEATEPAAEEPTAEATMEATTEPAEEPTAEATALPADEGDDDEDDDDDGLGTTEIVIIVIVAVVLLGILYSLFGRRSTPPTVR